MDLVSAQELVVWRHPALPALSNTMHDGFARTTIQPDPVGQVRRSQCRVAGAIRLVTGHAELCEFFFPRFGHGFVMLTTTQAEHIFGNVLDAIIAQRGFPPRHNTAAAITNGGLDLFRSRRFGNPIAPRASEP